MADSFQSLATISTPAGKVDYHRLSVLEDQGLCRIDRLPFSMRVLLENLLRNEDGRTITAEDVARLAAYDPAAPVEFEVPFRPARVLLQDFTGVPAVVDLAAMRSAMSRLGGDPARINPQVRVDLVIDHSVQVDVFGCPEALHENARLEFERNSERYGFLRWGQNAFRSLRVVPPASGICHQVNLEYLAPVVQTREVNGRLMAYPDSLVGTDSHTPTINGLGVLGWGVGGIEAEATMLGQPLYMLAPAVVGVRLEGALQPGVTATDAVLTVTQVLRQVGVVGKFVEFFGPGVDTMTVPDRATLANMAPEYGATMGFFPVDTQSLRYLRDTARSPEHVELVERYCREQGLFRTPETPVPVFETVLTVDLATVVPSVSGPNRPQDRVAVSGMKQAWQRTLRAPVAERGLALDQEALAVSAQAECPDGSLVEITHGAVVIAAITSCTNTSNPAVMIGAGLLARNAVAAGLQVKPWVKTSLAPGSKVVADYLARAGLTPHLDALGFHNVGYGCTTCIGNSGPLPPGVAAAVRNAGLVAASVLSGNRNFEGRINPDVRASYLASPPLVVAFALAGTLDIDFETEPLGTADDGTPVFLRDLQPSAEEVAACLRQAACPEDYSRQYGGIEHGNAQWNLIPVAGSTLYEWSKDSSYIQEPPFFTDMTLTVPAIEPVLDARALVAVGDSITTDHISPAGAIAEDSPAADFLRDLGVAAADFNTYGSRRGNDRVMARGTFANVRLRNRLAPGTEGGWTTHIPSGQVVTIYEAAQRYRADNVPLVVLAGFDYGMGSSRDWAAKGPLLLGVRAVVARSYERIHRSNLVGMGVLPLQFANGDSIDSLGLTGTECFCVRIDDSLRPGQEVRVEAMAEDGSSHTFTVACRLDSGVEVDYYRNAGILQTVLRSMLAN